MLLFMYKLYAYINKKIFFAPFLQISFIFTILMSLVKQEIVCISSYKKSCNVTLQFLLHFERFYFIFLIIIHFISYI